MLDEEVSRDGFVGHLQQMMVVGEERHLGRAGYVRQDHQRRTGADVIELHEEIVQDESHRLTGREVALETGEAQCKQQLVAAARVALSLWLGGAARGAVIGTAVAVVD
jgi:hypothetical protein